MSKNRMEAFSDGVLGIIITIMVLQLEVPDEPTVRALLAIWPTVLCYAISFVYLGTYWINHHQLVSKITYVSGKLLWKNLFCLFCLSFIPFATEFMGKFPFNPLATFVYGVVLLLSALSYLGIQYEIVRFGGPDSEIAQSIGHDHKGKITLAMYFVAVCVAYFWPHLSGLLYAVAPLFWIIPDMRLWSIDEEQY
ncbi:MAG: TMEM175 family protein [Aerococcus sp.]|nr:TMEM175 family protein [Aerococcus sp.]